MHQLPKFILAKKEPLHVSGRSSAYHQEFIDCTLGTSICHTVWRQLPSWVWMELQLPSNRMTYTSVKGTVNELLMMGRGTARNM